jgi:predicted nucleotidyltransferase
MKAIQQKASTLNVKALYGLGSYFRGKQFRDVDFVVVVDCEQESLLAISQQMRCLLGKLQTELCAPIDVTIFTASEFEQQPLRDMSSLVPLYVRDSIS